MNLKLNRYSTIFFSLLCIIPSSAISHILGPHPNRVVCEISTNLICNKLTLEALAKSHSTYLSSLDNNENGKVLSEIIIPNTSEISHIDVENFSKADGFVQKAGEFACYRQLTQQYKGIIKVARVSCDKIFKDKLGVARSLKSK